MPQCRAPDAAKGLPCLLESSCFGLIRKNFRNIQAIGPTGIGPTMTDGQQNVTVTADGIAVDGVAGPVEVYSVDGTLVARVNAAGGRTDIALSGHGVYIIKVGDRTVKVNR